MSVNMADEVDDEGVKFAKYYAEKLKKEIEPNKVGVLIILLVLVDVRA